MQGRGEARSPCNLKNIISRSVIREINKRGDRLKPDINISVDEFTLLLFPIKEITTQIWKSHCQSIVNSFLKLSQFEDILGRFDVATTKLQAGYNIGLTIIDKPFHCGIYWNSEISSMAVCVKMSASSLRYYESETENKFGKPIYLYQFLKMIQAPDLYNIRFSRIDLVVDYFNYPSSLPSEKYLLPNEIYNHLKQGEYRVEDYNGVSKIRTYKGIENKGICETFYVGSQRSGSNGFLRCYDKRNEQIKKRGIFYNKALSVESWLRCEAVFRNKPAHDLTEQLLKIDSLSDYQAWIATHISNKYRFLDVTTDEYIRITSDLLDVASGIIVPALSSDKPKDNSLEQSISNLYVGSGLMSILQKIEYLYGMKGIRAFLDNIVNYFDFEYSKEKARKRSVFKWLSIHGSEYQNKTIQEILNNYDSDNNEN